MVDTDSNLENVNNDACLEHKEVIEEQIAVEEPPVINQEPIIQEPIVKVIKGSRGHKPKMSLSKKINVYKKEECPDCKKLLTVGNLRYKHARFCIGKKIKESIPIPTPVQSVIMKPPSISEREIIRRVDAFNGNNNSNHEPETEVEVVRRYVSNLKKQQEEKRTSQYKNLINSAIVRRNKI
jgi:hypothetical protein